MIKVQCPQRFYIVLNHHTYSLKSYFAPNISFYVVQSIKMDENFVQSCMYCTLISCFKPITFIFSKDRKDCVMPIFPFKYQRQNPQNRFNQNRW